MLGWLALESGMIADAETVEQALAAIPSVIWHTSFGHILAAQTLALLGNLYSADDRPAMELGRRCYCAPSGA